MAKARISIGDLSGRGFPTELGSIIVLAPGTTGGKLTYRTAPPTVIKNSRVQRDRGFEFDYPKPKPAPRKSRKK
jgi:hypothetical protein